MSAPAVPLSAVQIAALMTPLGDAPEPDGKLVLAPPLAPLPPHGLVEGCSVSVHYLVRALPRGDVLATTLESLADGTDVGGLGAPAALSLLRTGDGTRGSLTPAEQKAVPAGARRCGRLTGGIAAGTAAAVGGGDCVPNAVPVHDDGIDPAIVPHALHACVARMGGVGEVARFVLPLTANEGSDNGVGSDAVGREWLQRALARRQQLLDTLENGEALPPLTVVADVALLAVAPPLPPVPTPAQAAARRAAEKADAAGRAAQAGGGLVGLGERFAAAHAAREAGNDAARTGDWDAAKRKYGEAFARLFLSGDEAPGLVAELEGRGSGGGDCGAAAGTAPLPVGDAPPPLPLPLILAIASARLPLFTNRAQAHLKLAAAAAAAVPPPAPAAASGAATEAPAPPPSHADEAATATTAAAEEEARLKHLDAAVYDACQALAMAEELYRHYRGGGGEGDGSGSGDADAGAVAERMVAAGLPPAPLPLAEVAGAHGKALHRRARARLEMAALWMGRATPAAAGGRPRYWDADKTAAALALAEDDVEALPAVAARAREAARASGGSVAATAAAAPPSLPDDGGAAGLRKQLTALAERLAALRARGDAAHTARLQRALARGFARSSGGSGEGGGGRPRPHADEEAGSEVSEAELPPLE